MKRLIVVLSFLIFSCASLDFKELIPTSEIVSVESAQKALIIAQEVRLSYMKIVKEQVKLGTKPPEALNEFEERDKKFRHIWNLADTALVKGEGIDEFKRLYEELLKVIAAHKTGAS